MTTDEKASEILKKIVEIVNEAGEDSAFGIESDWGDNTLTLYFPDGSHTHVGVPMPDGTFDVLVDHMYELMVNHRGLSRVKP